MKRRTILATVGGLTVGTVPVAASERTRSEGNEIGCDTVEIPIAKSGDEVIATENVSEAWWDQVERSRAVQDEIQTEFDDEPWFEGTGRTTGETEICGHTAFVVTVYASDKSAAREAIGETRNGVSIQFADPPVDAATPDTSETANGDDEAAGAAAQGSEARNVTGTNDSAAGGAVGSPNDTAADSSDDDSIPGFGLVAGLAGVGIAISRHTGRNDR